MDAVAATGALLHRLAEAGQAHTDAQAPEAGGSSGHTRLPLPEVLETDISSAHAALLGADCGASLWTDAAGQRASVPGVARALLAAMQGDAHAPALRAAHLLTLLLQTAGCPVRCEHCSCHGPVHCLLDRAERCVLATELSACYSKARTHDLWVRSTGEGVLRTCGNLHAE